MEQFLIAQFLKAYIHSGGLPNSAYCSEPVEGFVDDFRVPHPDGEHDACFMMWSRSSQEFSIYTYTPQGPYMRVLLVTPVPEYIWLKVCEFCLLILA